jgi:drug/metabolite transporter (DMT)-like permease
MTATAQAEVLEDRPRASTRRATIALVLACLFWGGSFTWAKSAMAMINITAGVSENSGLGVMLLMAWRFIIAGVLWFILFPASRRGWTPKSILRAATLGALFMTGMVAQQAGLRRTSEATSAFLTSLSILFVPLLMFLTTRHVPPPMLWIGIVLATAGIWLMTGVSPSGFGTGEMLGLLCSVLFSIYLLAMNALVTRDDPFRMAGAQFIVIGVLSAAVALGAYPLARDASVLLIPCSRAVIVDLLLLVAFATIGGFGLMVIYQPKLHPARAALVYLTEPIFAAAYAYIFANAVMTRHAIVGAALILVANGLVELMEQRRRIKAPTGPVA